jgi:hypothetical protein
MVQLPERPSVPERRKKIFFTVFVVTSCNAEIPALLSMKGVRG